MGLPFTRFKQTTSLGSSAGIPQAFASRSLMSSALRSFNSSASRLDSIVHGRLDASTRPLRTGPATPKQAASGRTLELSTNLVTISSRPRYSRLGNTEAETRLKWHPQHRRTPALRGCLRCRLPGSFFEVPPVAPVALKEFFGFLRTPGSSGIVWKISRRKRLPHIEDRTDNAPSGLDHISALEQRLVADHAIVEQALVARGGLCAEVVGVLEIHVHCAKTHP